MTQYLWIWGVISHGADNSTYILAAQNERTIKAARYLMNTLHYGDLSRIIKLKDL